MPKIKLTGQVMDEIYKDAIDLIPNGGRFIAATYLSNPQKPCTHKQAFEKTMDQMQHMVRGAPQDYLKAATAGYLQKHYNFPAVDANSYECKIGRDSITLRPVNEQSVSFAGWLNRFNLNNKTLSNVGDIREYRQITPEELTRQLDGHNKWQADRQQVIKSARELFRTDDKTLSEFVKSMPATRADFSGYELKNMDFREQNLYGVSFKNSRLENCAFSDAMGADFSGAVIDRCRFENGELSHADFRQSQQNDVRFENCLMRETDFTDAKMKQVTFSGCDLRSAVFNGIDLSKLNFEQAEPARQQEQAQTAQPQPIPNPQQNQAQAQNLSNPQQNQNQAQAQNIDIQYAEPIQVQRMG